MGYRWDIRVKGRKEEEFTVPTPLIWGGGFGKKKEDETVEEISRSRC